MCVCGYEYVWVWYVYVCLCVHICVGVGDVEVWEALYTGCVSCGVCVSHVLKHELFRWQYYVSVSKTWTT